MPEPLFHFSYSSLVGLKTISKRVFWFKVKAGMRFKPQAYWSMPRTLKRMPNAEIGPKDLFVISFYSFCCSLRYTTGFLAMIDREAVMPTVTTSATVAAIITSDIHKKGR